MRVICIETPDGEGVFDYVPGPKEWDIDVVVNEKEYAGELFYILERFGPRFGYLPKYFIPCSDIDETELVNHKEEVCGTM